MSKSSSFEAEEHPPSSPPSVQLDLPPSTPPPSAAPSLTLQTTQASSSSYLPSQDPPLPFLPMELKREILRFCDQATLASASKVSLAFLQLSSPLLYTDITLKGIKGIQRLFCLSDRDERQPSLEPYLDLFQIKYLTLVVDLEDKQRYEDEIEDMKIRTQLFEDRLVVPPLFTQNGTDDDVFQSIKSLTLQVVQKKLFYEYSFQVRALLAFFNPTHVVLQGISSSPFPENAFVELDLPSTLYWTSLKSLTFLNSAASSHLHDTLLTECEEQVVVVYDLSNCCNHEGELSSCNSTDFALVDVLGQRNEEEVGLFDMDESVSLVTSPKLEKVVFRVRDRAQLELIEGRIKRFWQKNHVVSEKQTSWAGLIEFEEVDLGARRFLTVGE